MQCAAITCRMPTRWIQPGTPWDLGHTDDRTTYHGPEHRVCNQLAGAIKGGRATAFAKHGHVHGQASRDW